MRCCIEACAFWSELTTLSSLFASPHKPLFIIYCPRTVRRRYPLQSCFSHAPICAYECYISLTVFLTPFKRIVVWQRFESRIFEKNKIGRGYASEREICLVQTLKSSQPENLVDCGNQILVFYWGNLPVLRLFSGWWRSVEKITTLEGEFYDSISCWSPPPRAPNPAYPRLNSLNPQTSPSLELVIQLQINRATL